MFNGSMSMPPNLNNAGRVGEEPQRTIATQRQLLMLSRYGRLGASSRQRLFLFSRPLQECGFSLCEHQFLSDDYLRGVYQGRPTRRLDIVWRYANRMLALCRSSHSDILWIEKELLPWIPAWVEHLLVGRRAFIADFDDGWHLKYNAADAPWYVRLMKGKLEAIARRADIVFVANRELLRWAQEAGAKDALLVPTIVNIDEYLPVEEPDGPFTIGWIGTPLNVRYLERVVEPLRRLSDCGARLLLIGAPPDFAPPGITIEAVPWCEETEAEQIARCHVGIMPLDGSPWDRFKSSYKLIQYMAAGRAVVASPVGANLDIVKQGETGFLANGDDEWFAALAGLKDSPELRMRLGSAGRERCAAHFSLNVALAQITKALSAWPDLSKPPRSNTPQLAA